MCWKPVNVFFFLDFNRVIFEKISFGNYTNIVAQNGIVSFLFYRAEGDFNRLKEHLNFASL
jgi:hypothetical protein